MDHVLADHARIGQARLSFFMRIACFQYDKKAKLNAERTGSNERATACFWYAKSGEPKAERTEALDRQRRVDEHRHRPRQFIDGR